MTTLKKPPSGFRQLTSPYNVIKEAGMLASVIASLLRGRVEFALVQEGPDRVSVWRNHWVELPDETLSLVRVKGRAGK